MAGGAGKKLRGGGARRKNTSPAAQVKDGGYGRPPHPTRALPGQTYWPRTTRSRRQVFVIARVRSDGSVIARREDGSREQLKLSAARLLARGAGGQGRYYSFLKWSSRRYQTWALVAAVGGGEATLVVPEWHPDRGVRLPERLVPSAARPPDRWVTVTADLSQPTAAGLQLAPIAACEPPDVIPPVGWRPPAGKVTPPAPPAGPGCGDIVLEDVQPHALRSFFVFERPPIASGARVYLTTGGHVVGYLVLVSTRISPNGLQLDCERALRTLARPIPIEGPRQTAAWRWRWWPRDDELSGAAQG